LLDRGRGSILQLYHFFVLGIDDYRTMRKVLVEATGS